MHQSKPVIDFAYTLITSLGVLAVTVVTAVSSLLGCVFLVAYLIHGVNAVSQLVLAKTEVSSVISMRPTLPTTGSSELISSGPE
jgi:hypothetical protein